MIKNIILSSGLTDIFNCLALINYYSNKYLKLYVVVRDDKIEIFKFYTKDLNNIELITISSKLLENQDNRDCRFIISNINIDNMDNTEYLFIGTCDEYIDNYKYSWLLNTILNWENFVSNYYISYDIPLSTRIDYF